MSKLEDEIRSALIAEDDSDEIKNMMEEQSFMAQTTSLFKGKMAWTAYVTYIGMIVMFALGVWAILQLLEAETPRQIAIYALVVNFAFLVVLMNKLWLWMQLNKNAAVREILRLELRILEIQKSLQK